ncbi:MAG: carboxypeptidase regulatory-like domain-containing protein [Bryobacteraceae bacterium]|nr:carboxypeptidase regulatory-like domain-containing protein [Bryobacteraceae bacterium]MDW8379465.1 carboxypeptidase regulatory-like domain-containing protein [Bryobacterales bacterium]
MILVTALFFLFDFPTPLAAQSATASLSATVQDEQDALIRNARIRLRDPARGTVREGVTSTDGTVTFRQLPPSTYELTAEKEGFTTARFESLVLNANDERALRVRLKVAGREETIVVTGELPLVSESPAVATAVDRGFIENQPLNGRTFQSLIALSPGVQLTTASIVDQGQFSVNGQRTGTNYFTVDGVSANFGLPFATTPYEAGGVVPALSAQGGTAALASVDAVQEFTIQTSTYAPEYGRQPGAQVAIVTRSGTNSLHASLFNYLRNDKLDANSWFGNFNGLRRPALRQNDFGFTFGGPVLFPRLYNGRNRTFFFLSYEGLRLIQPVISQPSRVPSLAAREQATGKLKAILEAYPLPVAPPLAEAPNETPYITSFSNPSRLNATSVRVDHTLSSRYNLFGRFSYAPSENRERGRFATPSFVATLPAHAETITVGSTMLLSTALSNDLRVNWSKSRAAQIYVQDTFGGAKILPRELIFPPFARPETSLFYLTIGGNDENTISPGVFSDNKQRQFNVVNTTSWTVQTHAFKFGVDYRWMAPSVGGRLYSQVLTVPTITQLVTGIVPTAEIRQVNTFLEPRYHNFSAFAQDAWKIRPNLTITYGVRWEVNPAPSEARGNLPVTVRGLANPPTAVLAPEGSKLYDTTYKNFAPRFGFAYQPFRSRGTVLRGGFGWFYDLGYAFAGTALSPGNFPYSRSRFFTNISIADPALFGEAGPLNRNPPLPRLFAWAEGYQLPYTRQYSFAVEQPFGNTQSVELSYVGAAGRRLARVESLRSQVLRNPTFTRIDFVTNEAYSDYHSLQAQLKRRFSRGFQALLAYTWSKSLDTASDESITNLQAPSIRVNVNNDRGPSSFDIRHSFTGTASYEVGRNFSNRAARALLGGFALDSVLRLRTATPVTVISGRDPLGLGLTNVARPDVVPGQPLYLYGSGFAGGKRFNPAAFDAAGPLAQGRQGTLGRGVMRGFGLKQVDLSLRRQFQLAERFALQFRADAFNLSNTPNFANPIGVLTSANFGRSVQVLNSALGGLNPQFQVGGPRSIQLALKLLF